MQSIYNIAEICARKNVRDFILSPGSRCAPLTIAMVRHPEIRTKTISDERSAAFIAIGTSQQTKQPTGLICTSGSAAYNYAPAIAEAFYSQTPLLVLTADRPPEWIDQYDGQTIRQQNIFGSHVKKCFTLPVDHSHPDAQWEIERKVNEAINLSREYPPGPVHINIPLREPFYPKADIIFDQSVKIIEAAPASSQPDAAFIQILQAELKQYSKILIVAGQQEYDAELIQMLEQTGIPLIADTISNMQEANNAIRFHDTILATSSPKLSEDLRPDFLITFGKSLISKGLKTFLRKNKPKAQWHLAPAGGLITDTFQSLTKHIPADIAQLLSLLFPVKANQTAYSQLWKAEDEKAETLLREFLKQEAQFTEFEAIHQIIEHLPENSILHLANSMPVRYVNYISLQKKKNIAVYANRGTSGIDGVISTAYGAALQTSKIVTVITGDMAFMYDRNAFWNNYQPENLRVIVLNNHGGGIFRMIEGPAAQPELEEYFVTRQTLTAASTAKDHNMDYSICKNKNTFNRALEDFFNPSLFPKILELETDSEQNTNTFNRFKDQIKKNHGK